MYVCVVETGWQRSINVVISYLLIFTQWSELAINNSMLVDIRSNKYFMLY